MGGALLTGIHRGGLPEATQLFLVEPDARKQEQYQSLSNLTMKASPAELTQSCEVLILAVKPQVLPAVLTEIAPVLTEAHLVISIAAGVKLATLESLLPKGRLSRVMPNTPARIGRGVSAYCLGRGANLNDGETVTAIFNCVGKVISIPEALFDAVTAVSGSGPAYVFYFIEAFIDVAVQLGLSRNAAEILVVETLLGAGEMLQKTGEHPAKLRNEVTSPGGTTAAALYTLERHGYAGILMEAVRAAADRSRELGAK